MTNDLRKSLLAEKKSAIYQETYKLAKQEFQVFFKKIHWLVIPKRQLVLRAAVLNKHQDWSAYRYCKDTNLVTNCCMAKGCKFYLKINEGRFNNHMRCWQGKIPQGFHIMVKKNKQESIEFIYNEFLQRAKGGQGVVVHRSNMKNFDYYFKANVTAEDNAEPQILEMYGVEKKDVVDYIHKLKEAYLIIGDG